MGVASKRKGNYEERRIATLFAEWTGKNFRRVPTSGGFNKQGLVVAEYVFSGDIICDDKNFILSVESKNRPNDFSIPQLLTNPEKAPFTQWWYQTIMDARRSNKQPFLVFKGSRSSNVHVGSELIAMEEKLLNHLGIDSIYSMKLNIYNNLNEIYVLDKNKIVLVKLDNKLPNPVIVNWRIFQSKADREKLFEGVP